MPNDPSSAAEDRPFRSLAKALTFRAAVLAADSGIIYLLTRRLDLTLSVMVLSNISSTILFYLHERVWNRINWGKAR
jgi:uncharacterized membrane protein